MSERAITVRVKAEIAEYRKKLLEAQRITTDFASKTTTDLMKQREALGSVGSTTAKMGAALGLAVGIAIKTSSDFSSQMSKVAATGEDARSSLDDLRAAALKVGPDMGKSATEAALGVEELLKAGVSARDVLSGGLQGALSLASAGTMAVGEAAETSAAAMVQFGLAGKDLPHVADLLSAGAGKARGEVADLAQALNQAGLVSAQTGLSIEETVGSLTAFSAAGMTGSDAGTSFRTMLLRLSNPAADARAKMSELGIAAFDAQGQFVGMSSLAGQLREKTGKLTDAQRAQAMAVIFGSDAVRGANALYSEGAEGISKWITAVDDAGYAATTARVKLDNLAGDLQQLSATAQAALIDMSESSEGPLRGLVKSTTGAVEMFRQLPGPVQNATLVLAGFASVSALSAGVGAKSVIAIKETRDALKSLGVAGRTAGLSFGAIGVVLTAASLAFGHFAQQQADAHQAIADYADAIKADTGALADNTRAAIANRLEKTGALKAAQLLGIDLATVTDAVMGNADAMAKVREVTEPLADDFRDLSAAAQERAQAGSDLTKVLFGETEGLKGGAAEYKRITEATDTATEATADNTAKLDAHRDAVLKDVAALYEAANAFLALSGSRIGYERAIDAATASIAENGRTLDDSTEAGRRNLESLNRIAAASQEVVSSMIKNRESQEDIATAMDEARASYIGAAIAAGKSAAAAAELADESGLVASASHDAEANQKAARRAFLDAAEAAGMGKDEAERYWKALRKIPARVDTVVSAVLRTPNIAKYIAGIQAQVNKNPLRIPAHAYGTIARAAGGAVYGPGTGTSDSIPAMLSTGEHVITAAEVLKAGGQDSIYKMRALIRSGELHFADGGAAMKFGNRDPARRHMATFAEGGAVTATLRSPAPTLMQLAPQATNQTLTPAIAAQLGDIVRSALEGTKMRAEFGNAGALSDKIAADIMLAVERG